KPEDASKKLIQDMHRILREEASRFVAAGGKRSDTSHPFRSWAPLFWRYYELQRDTPAAAEAAEASLMMFQEIGEPDEIIARAETIQPDELVWGRLIWYYEQAARAKKLYAPFVAHSHLILQRATDPTVRASVAYYVGQVHWEDGRKDEAKAAFEMARAAAPERWTAKKAEQYLFELEKLNVGQPAPTFSATTLDGKPVRLEDYRGKVVLLNFWATWCAPCVAEIPVLLKLQKKFGKRGLVVLWISGDYQRQALEDMVARKKLPGPQIFDGEVTDGQLPVLYNVQEWPRNFLLDRQGIILAKDSHGETLERAVKAVVEE
ncbi:MAG: TlpA family protein disulfide reductase, partial [Candidatus Acidiferrales bacterium]